MSAGHSSFHRSPSRVVHSTQVIQQATSDRPGNISALNVTLKRPWLGVYINFLFANALAPIAPDRQTFFVSERIGGARAEQEREDLRGEPAKIQENQSTSSGAESAGAC
jgi:hypothetical protein